MILWLPIGFAAAFFAIGIPFWHIPFNHFDLSHTEPSANPHRPRPQAIAAARSGHSDLSREPSAGLIGHRPGMAASPRNHRGKLISPTGFAGLLAAGFASKSAHRSGPPLIASALRVRGRRSRHSHGLPIAGERFAERFQGDRTCLPSVM